MLVFVSRGRWRNAAGQRGCSHTFFKLHFILEYSWLTILWQFQVHIETTQPHVHMCPVSPKLPIQAAIWHWVVFPCYTVGPCWLLLLCVHVIPNSVTIPPPHPSKGGECIDSGAFLSPAAVGSLSWVSAPPQWVVSRSLAATSAGTSYLLTLTLTPSDPPKHLPIHQATITWLQGDLTASGEVWPFQVCSFLRALSALW